MKKYRKHLLFSSEKIKNRVCSLGCELSKVYKGKNPLVISVLKGSVVFLSDLIRSFDFDFELDFVHAQSYSAMHCGKLKIAGSISCVVKNRRVLIVEDIIDSGRTLEAIILSLKKQGAKDIKNCVLLDKPSVRKTQVIPNYIGFMVPNYFVVGYGLDYNGKFRGLPSIYYLDKQIRKVKK